jgi:hypothetical protein
VVGHAFAIEKLLIGEDDWKGEDRDAWVGGGRQFIEDMLLF